MRVEGDILEMGDRQGREAAGLFQGEGAAGTRFALLQAAGQGQERGQGALTAGGVAGVRKDFPGVVLAAVPAPHFPECGQDRFRRAQDDDLQLLAQRHDPVGQRKFLLTRDARGPRHFPKVDPDVVRAEVADVGRRGPQLPGTETAADSGRDACAAFLTREDLLESVHRSFRKAEGRVFQAPQGLPCPLLKERPARGGPSLRIETWAAEASNTSFVSASFG